jgi:hypothetical protein
MVFRASKPPLKKIIKGILYIEEEDKCKHK